MIKRLIDNTSKLPAKPLLLVAASSLMANLLRAQEAAPAQSETSVLSIITDGGIMMFPLGLLSIAAVTLIVYNFVVLRRSQFFSPTVIKEIRTCLSELRIDDARKVCSRYPSPMTRIIDHGLESVRDGEFDPRMIQERMEAASTKELAGPYVFVNYINIIATVSPMVGLSGTVLGMVKAFDSIAVVGMGQPDILAGNISEALVTTLAGLVVGIPAMIAFFYFKNNYAKLVAEMTMLLGDLHGEMVHSVRKQAN